MVGYEGFVGDEEEQGEFFEDSDLANTGRGDGLVVDQFTRAWDVESE